MTAHVEEQLKIEPDRDVRNAVLRAAASFGAAVRGLYDLEWSDERECLCFVQTNVRGKKAVCIEVRAPDGSPRQANHDDVDDFRMQLHRRLENSGWVNDFYASKEEARKKQKAERRELAEYTAKEIIRVGRFGLRTYIDLGAIPEQIETSPDGFRVTDRRRNFNEVTP